MSDPLHILADCVDVGPFAAEVNRDPRTVRRWMREPDGLPFIKLGSRVLIHLPTARGWIMAKMRKPNRRRSARDRRAAREAASPAT
jgi:hypothetical protein